MKHAFIVFAFLVAATSCKKKTTTPTNPSPQTVYYSLPNWIDDTLISSNFGDTMYSFTQGGKSYIKHKGLNYEVKVYVFSGETFSDSTGSYKCEIFDPNGKVLDTTVMTLATTSKKYDTQFKTWEKQVQFIWPSYPPFANGVNGYIGRNKK